MPGKPAQQPTLGKPLPRRMLGRPAQRPRHKKGAAGRATRRPLALPGAAPEARVRLEETASHFTTSTLLSTLLAGAHPSMVGV